MGSTPPPLVASVLSSITLEAYLLVSQTIRLCTLWDQIFSNNPGRDGIRPYECVHPGSCPVKGSGGFLYVSLFLFQVEGAKRRAITSSTDNWHVAAVSVPEAELA
jgi:hypothetical protein